MFWTVAIHTPRSCRLGYRASAVQAAVSTVSVVFFLAAVAAVLWSAPGPKA